MSVVKVCDDWGGGVIRSRAASAGEEIFFFCFEKRAGGGKATEEEEEEEKREGLPHRLGDGLLAIFLSRVRLESFVAAAEVFLWSGS